MNREAAIFLGCARALAMTLGDSDLRNHQVRQFATMCRDNLKSIGFEENTADVYFREIIETYASYVLETRGTLDDSAKTQSKTEDSSQ